MAINLDNLLTHTGSKFTLVTMAMRRAQDLNDGARPMVPSDSKKVVTVALEEIATGQVKPVQTEKPPIRPVRARSIINPDDLAA
ncbi:MAG: DNA-directed RNA polymerase subunit omega [Candidatus Xenobia bacterium]